MSRVKFYVCLPSGVVLEIESEAARQGRTNSFLVEAACRIALPRLREMKPAPKARGL